MTAYVTIPVATVRNALKLPNTALRYKPPITTEEILGLYKRYGIERPGGQQSEADPAAGDPEPPTSAQNLPRAPRAETVVVWKLHPDNTMEPVKVSLGITDHAYTEVTAVLRGELKEGDDLVIRSVVPKGQSLGGIRN
jgi:HlyD family secretion protein